MSTVYALLFVSVRREGSLFQHGSSWLDCCPVIVVARFSKEGKRKGEGFLGQLLPQQFCFVL